jgi:hypothetical protein
VISSVASTDEGGSRPAWGRSAAGTALLLALSGLVACGGRVAPANAPATVTSAPVTSAPAPVPAAPAGGRVRGPGLDRQPDGSAVAYGWVERQSLEGGFWSLVDAAPDGRAAGTIVCVLLPGAVTESGIAALEGGYVTVTGHVDGGVSVRMTGPELVVGSIATLSEPGP